MEKQKVKMTVKEMIEAHAGLSEVVKEKKLFTSEVNLAIARNSKILDGEVKSYQENVNDIIDTYVHKNSKGEPETKKGPMGMQYVFETEEHEKDYVTAIRNLEAVELEIDVNVIDVEAFRIEGNAQPTAYDLVALDFMLKE